MPRSSPSVRCAWWLGIKDQEHRANASDQTSANAANRRVRPTLRTQVFGATGIETTGRGEAERDSAGTVHLSASRQRSITAREEPCIPGAPQRLDSDGRSEHQGVC